MIDRFPYLLISLFFCVTGCLHQHEPAASGNSTAALAATDPEAKIVHSDWLYWRGSDGTGVSDQTGLPQDLNKSLLWTHEIDRKSVV